MSVTSSLASATRQGPQDLGLCFLILLCVVFKSMFSLKRRIILGSVCLMSDDVGTERPKTDLRLT